MGWCAVIESSRKRQRLDVGKKSLGLQPMIWGLQDLIMQAVEKGDSLLADDLLIQLAYLTDASWYLESHPRGN